MSSGLFELPSLRNFEENATTYTIRNVKTFFNLLKTINVVLQANNETTFTKKIVSHKSGCVVYFTEARVLVVLFSHSNDSDKTITAVISGWEPPKNKKISFTSNEQYTRGGFRYWNAKYNDYKTEPLTTEQITPIGTMYTEKISDESQIIDFNERDIKTLVIGGEFKTAELQPILKHATTIKALVIKGVLIGYTEDIKDIVSKSIIYVYCNGFKNGANKNQLSLNGMLRCNNFVLSIDFVSAEKNYEFENQDGDKTKIPNEYLQGILTDLNDFDLAGTNGSDLFDLFNNEDSTPNVSAIAADIITEHESTEIVLGNLPQILGTNDDYKLPSPPRDSHKPLHQTSCRVCGIKLSQR